MKDRIAELERDLQSCRHDYAEHVAMVARKERPAYDEQQRRIAELEAERDRLADALLNIPLAKDSIEMCQIARKALASLNKPEEQ